MNYKSNIQFNVLVKTGQGYPVTLEMYEIEG